LVANDFNNKGDSTLATHTEEQREKIFANAERIGRIFGIIDATDVRTLDVSDLRIADDGSVPGLSEKIEKLKDAKPHWFRAHIDPDKPLEQQLWQRAADLGETDQARIDKFLASKPVNDRLLRAVERGDFSC
jgi:hypothetical protein